MAGGLEALAKRYSRKGYFPVLWLTIHLTATNVPSQALPESRQAFFVAKSEEVERDR